MTMTRTVIQITDMTLTETVIDHVNGAVICNVSSGDRKIRNALAKLHEKYPDEVVPVAINEDGSVWYHVPWEYIRIVHPRKTRISEEKRKELSDRMRNLSSNTV